MNGLEDFRACAWPVASVSQTKLDAVLAAARSHRPGAAIVASCQRVEVFHVDRCDCRAPGAWAGFEALLRLAEVAAGLHSLVLGEAQVLGQVRSGLAAAGGQVASHGGIAVAAARTLRAEARFKAHSGHLLDLALRLSNVAWPDRVAVVGAGAVGGLIAERAVELGFPDVTVVARRQPNRGWFNPSRMRYEPLHGLAEIAPVDVLVGCLGSAAKPLGIDTLPVVRRLVIDLGTPRNIEGSLAAPVLTIADMLADEAAHPFADARRAELRERLRATLERRLEMVSSDGQSPIGRLRFEVERVREAEALRIARLHPDLPVETIDTITRTLTNQLFHRPTERLRGIADPELKQRLVELFTTEEACP